MRKSNLMLSLCAATVLSCGMLLGCGDSSSTAQTSTTATAATTAAATTKAVSTTAANAVTTAGSTTGSSTTTAAGTTTKAASATTTAASSTTTAATTTAANSSTTKAASTATTNGGKVAEAAKAQVGKAYKAGGTSPSTGFDACSLVTYCYSQAGISTGSSVCATLASNATTVSKSDLTEGDIVFLSTDGSSNITYTGIYVGNNQMVSVNDSGVYLTDISGNYYQTHIVKYGRFN